MTANTSEDAPFGAVLGIAPGDVAVYSSNYSTVDERQLPNRHAFRSVVDGRYMGHKWQCVEFARRWLYINHKFVFDEVAMAYEIFNLRSVTTSAGARLPLRSFRNGSRRPPEPGCLLIWGEGGEFEDTGHVAVITEVFEDRVRIAEQNYHHTIWPKGRSYSREISLRTAYDGGHWLRCPPKEGTILGWVIQTEDEQFAQPVASASRGAFEILAHEAVHRDDDASSWLNEANPDEAAYVELMEGHTMVDRPDEDQHRYLSISPELERELKRATNELHALFMHATDWVLQEEQRLRPFNLPKALWPRLRQSWANRRNEMITGRFDFCVGPEGVKVYEYNCDSASCHMECGKVQGKWAAHFGVEEGEDPGRSLFAALVDAWARSGVDGVIHIMRDDHPEESYHALYMREAIETAGLEAKTLLGVQGLSWGSQGDIVDLEGTPIRWVWKTWAWETALDQIRRECEDDDLGLRSSGSPRLADVLLRPSVRVFEPMWTLIPSNKAILPVLWQLFPDYPYLLEAQSEVTDRLRSTGYVVKPIVGRWGDNIALYEAGDQLLTETAGRFEAQEQIVQQLCILPRVSDRYVQLCSFSVAGRYAGSCVRVDRSPVIKWNSDLLPLRVFER
ncbi:MAG: bifunctional glutathionylspermidine amidase/synthase [Myxococcales bacterium]|nr:bifunctional glutathionylspermidine amidase/synthase [Myxococcales bacterium]